VLTAPSQMLVSHQENSSELATSRLRAEAHQYQLPLSSAERDRAEMLSIVRYDESQLSDLRSSLTLANSRLQQDSRSTAQVVSEHQSEIGMVAMLKSEIKENSRCHHEALLPGEANCSGLLSQIEWYKMQFEEWKSDDGESPSAAVPLPPPGFSYKPPDLFEVHTPVRRARSPSPVGSKRSVLGTVKEKLPAKIELPGIPSVTSVILWLKELSASLVAAGRCADQEEHSWVMEVRSKTFDELALSVKGAQGLGDVHRFSHLDQALAAALLGTKPKWPRHIAERIDREQFDLDKLPLKGRQIVLLTMASYKSDSAHVTMCTISNVMELGNAWKGDSNMRQFLDLHDHVYRSLGENTRKCLNILTDVKYEVFIRP
jgi:hypothetical protein